jgi:hypothetical protein
MSSLTCLYWVSALLQPNEVHTLRSIVFASTDAMTSHCKQLARRRREGQLLLQLLLLLLLHECHHLCVTCHASMSRSVPTRPSSQLFTLAFTITDLTWLTSTVQVHAGTTLHYCPRFYSIRPTRVLYRVNYTALISREPPRWLYIPLILCFVYAQQ